MIPAVLIFADRRALKMVDYGLLLTFVFFFIFSGNMARIDAVRSLFSSLLDKSTLLDAREHPERYPTLQVRLCGWNALFAKLSEKEQDEFIARAEH